MIVEATFKYDIELSLNKRYSKMTDKRDRLLDRLCEDMTIEQRRKIINEVEALETEIRCMEFETLYEKGLQDGINLKQLLNISVE